MSEQDSYIYIGNQLTLVTYSINEIFKVSNHYNQKVKIFNQVITPWTKTNYHRRKLILSNLLMQSRSNQKAHQDQALMSYQMRSSLKQRRVSRLKATNKNIKMFTLIIQQNTTRILIFIMISMHLHLMIYTHMNKNHFT